MMILALWLSAASATTLTGEVIDEASGAPIAGVSVEAWDPRLRGVAASTGADGHFEVDVDGAGPFRVRLVPPYNDPHVWRMAGGATDFCESTPVSPDAPELGALALPTGARLEGTLRDSSGTPIPGATVWARPATVDSTNWDRPGITDGAGSFEVVGIDPTAAGTEWLVAFSADGWPDQFLGSTYDDTDAYRATLEATDDLDLGEISLLDGILLGGAVSGPSGPITSGTVYAYSAGQVVTVGIDEDGTYSAVGLPPGEVITWVSAPDHAVTYLPDADRPSTREPVLEEGAAREDLDLTAPYEAVFEISFIDDATGNPIPFVGGLLYNDDRTVGRGGEATEDGVVRIDRLHGGQWTLYAWAADAGHTDDWVRDQTGEPRVFTIDPEATTTAEVALPRAARITGRVVDEDGEPVDGIAVAALRPDLSGLAERTNPDGTFTIGGLGPGTWDLTAEYDAICPGDPGYVPVYWPGTVNPDWASAFELEEGEQLTDVVLTVPRDADLDLMADRWEETHGLDPTDPTDATEDPDGDQYTNLDEYRMGTDPFEGTPDIEPCGCAQAPGSPWRSLHLSALVVLVVGVRRRR